MSHFEDELQKHTAALRALISEARREENDLAVDSLIGELEGLIGLAERNDVDTEEMQRVLQVETGAIPVIEVGDDRA
ncbi:hypothetical protein GCM10022261_28330 [Brevibacterium daeguense]|uniref:Uncharacterized protein n=1 Tax=Brevibacterium daeguense TaxID=909936 RepID=A0ABP8EMX8_9MICO|nr:hypothetical protein [Brevibacterium daeguense]